MMKQMQKSLLALVVLGATTLPAMAAGVDVKVTGTILPAGCTPTLSGGGTIDYGDIQSSRLSATDYTVLEAKSVDFTIQCSAATKVAIKPSNGRQNSVAGAGSDGFDGTGIAPVAIFGSSQMAVAGLGSDNGKRIGGYGIRIVDGSIADSKQVNRIYSSDMGESWQVTGASADSGALYSHLQMHYQSWAASGAAVPVAFETLTGKLEVQAYLNKASELDLSKPIKLDGLTTVELVYL